jgi:choice-of-anchor A domain-containing protein
MPLFFGALLLVGTARAPAARAGAITGQQLLQQFNLVDLGNFYTSTEVEGRSFVGGSESGRLANVGFNNGLTSSSAGFATLTVNGSINGTVTVQNGGIAVIGNVNGANLNDSTGTTSQVGGNINNMTLNGGTLQYGGTMSGNINLNGATALHVPNLSSGIPLSTFAPLTALTGTLDQLTANSTVAIANNTATFNAVAGTNGQAVFRVDSSVFSAGQFQFNLNGATSVIINVDGATAITSNANFLGGAATSIADKMIWNFYGLATLNIDAEFGGTVLAPDAAVTNTTSIDGTLLAGSFNQSGELHSYSYAGDLPDGGTTPLVVPEPPLLPVLALGLVSLVALHRRRVR